MYIIAQNVIENNEKHKRIIAKFETLQSAMIVLNRILSFKKYQTCPKEIVPYLYKFEREE